MKEKIIFFDGQCNFCDGTISFIMRNNSKNSLKFCWLQSDKAKNILKNYGVKINLDYIIYLKENKIFTAERAIIELSKELDFPYNLFKYLDLFPNFISNCFYQLVAKNRYRLFGKKNQCELPDKDKLKKFI